MTSGKARFNRRGSAGIACARGAAAGACWRGALRAAAGQPPHRARQRAGRRRQDGILEQRTNGPNQHVLCQEARGFKTNHPNASFQAGASPTRTTEAKYLRRFAAARTRPTCSWRRSPQFAGSVAVGDAAPDDLNATLEANVVKPIANFYKIGDRGTASPERRPRMMLYYNTDDFQQAGLDPPSRRRRWRSWRTTPRSSPRWRARGDALRLRAALLRRAHRQSPTSSCPSTCLRRSRLL